MDKTKNMGRLFICPTPIGNLEDITFRVIKTLNEVDLIAAEDTRHTIKLLNHFEIKKPLTSYHEHNKKEKGKVLIDRMIQGENIAVVSDAGMPGISDPGEDLVKLAIENGIEVTALPGPTAFVLGLVLSGLNTRKFVYEGFLSSNKKERKEELRKLEKETRTIILYESPHRIKDLLEDMKEIMGNRNISVSRELTKKYEEIFRGNIEEALDRFNREDPRGEFVVVIQGVSIQEIEREERDKWENLSIRDHITLYMSQNLSKKDAIKKVAKDRKLHKNEVYKEGLDL
ncbi:Uroporphyrin-III C/tetrapyrrole (Corrin/Porphyrin) methyltransferase [Gottschalkia acidurici 9a]|uniref:Ribosomal RNA small subunit methyltransferase I n=1 Tax=Gottschalkia acidurici (strain ATCC 7906 / DSM 604 / BCRC 14475 / CIP 104303 / KCTC 5404 / NCIMB 10678 / 9a) TaxID=1128398 RepID=K0ATL7_GOTA9|nr:16S rRNA (cytidine(1402)-2'-O)-methyltransferase [Gottschalkia acidurici]AFS77198.1 Uroporphyrin-III C/tetrapyrrole (Corrin/Porphyrin) methyltransferase [Gottschalkia acidurici 9a]